MGGGEIQSVLKLFPKKTKNVDSIQHYAEREPEENQRKYFSSLRKAAKWSVRLKYSSNWGWNRS